MRVLGVFNAKRRELSMTQIASLADLDMSAAQRFTHTLGQLGLLRRDPATKLYELSPRMLDFAYQFIGANELVGLATPFLQQLAAETEETVNLTLLDDTEIVFVQRFVSRHVLTPEVIVGTRLPAYCTSSGLAILSALPEDEARAVLSRSNRITYTSTPRPIRTRSWNGWRAFASRATRTPRTRCTWATSPPPSPCWAPMAARAAPSTSRCRARAGTPRGRTAHFRAADGGGTRDLQPGMIP